MTVEEFAERYNLENKWRKEIVNEEFMENHPYIKKRFDNYVGGYDITPDTCDYSSGIIYELYNHRFEIRIYSREGFDYITSWIDPDLDEEEFKDRMIKNVKENVLETSQELSKMRDTLDRKLSELEEFMEVLNKAEGQYHMKIQIDTETRFSIGDTIYYRTYTDIGYRLVNDTVVGIEVRFTKYGKQIAYRTCTGDSVLDINAFASEEEYDDILKSVLKEEQY